MAEKMTSLHELKRESLDQLAEITTIQTQAHDYEILDNKPKINGNELTGDKTLRDLGYYIQRGTGTSSLTFGSDGNKATQQFAEAHGQSTKASYPSSAIFGKYGETPTSALFSVANGTSDSNKSTALNVYVNGDIEASSAYTPSEDNHLATKKYVDDHSGGGSGDYLPKSSSAEYIATRMLSVETGSAGSETTFYYVDGSSLSDTDDDIGEITSYIWDAVAGSHFIWLLNENAHNIKWTDTEDVQHTINATTYGQCIIHLYGTDDSAIVELLSASDILPTTTTVEQMIAEAPHPIDYSTEEQDTGMKWIDGKTIYQKTFYAPNMPKSQTVTEIVLERSAGYIDEIVNVQTIYRKDADDRLICTDYYASSSESIRWWMKNNDDGYKCIRIRNYFFNTISGYVTIKYTKTTE